GRATATAGAGASGSGRYGGQRRIRDLTASTASRAGAPPAGVAPPPGDLPTCGGSCVLPAAAQPPIRTAAQRAVARTAWLIVGAHDRVEAGQVLGAVGLGERAGSAAGHGCSPSSRPRPIDATSAASDPPGGALVVRGQPS